MTSEETAMTLALVRQPRLTRPRWRPLTPFERFELGVMSLFARLWHRCCWTGTEELPAGPFVLIANHPSHADPAFLLAATGRPLHFLHARECYEVPVLRHLFARAGCIPVTRGGQDAAAVRQALGVLGVGGAVTIFPEGEISDEPGSLRRPAKTGAALLAIRGGVPVVPAWIDGRPQSRRMLGAWLIPCGGVRVRIGEPIDLSEHVGRPITHRLLRKVTDLLMDQVAMLRIP
jgi:1-acyl-sn-glycerol-3-phosphate acyltransferase